MISHAHETHPTGQQRVLVPVGAGVVTADSTQVLPWCDVDPTGPLVVSAPIHGRVFLPARPYDDLCIMAWLLSPRATQAEQSLTNLAKLVGIVLPRHDHLDVGDDVVSIGRALTSAGARVHEMLKRHLAHEGLWGVYETVERPLALLLRRMEAAGLPVVPATADLSGEKPETQSQWAGWPTRLTTAATRRVHPTWDQTATVTGRVTARKPPLQSLPKGLRNTVVAPAGRLLIAADYSAADFRPAAAMSRDPELLRLFEQGQDPYSQIGAMAGPPARGRERQVGKPTALPALYGATPWSLQDKTQLPVRAVEQMIAAYKARFPTLWRWRSEQIAHMRTGKAMHNPWGRLLLPETEFEAINHLCQSAAADVVKTAMLRLEVTLPQNATIVAQIHDELLVECLEQDATTVVTIMREQMTKPIPQLPVTLAVKIGVGKTWGEATRTQH